MSQYGNCATCKFSMATEKRELFCRRRSAHLHAIAIPARNPITGEQKINIQTFGMWPPVNPDEGCWEWESNILASVPS